ncbi:DUF2075 domain-containing protein [Agaribacterium sp. ZY112]|uniref:DUF2075 domain-containing protein n=1 Tax=Agaribacterium sp. ZY112 TaxID=3233574 RepID=UPI003523FC6A
MARRSYFYSSFEEFLALTDEHVIGEITSVHHQEIVFQQRNAWLEQCRLLREILPLLPSGHLHFEFLIPRMGRRVDVVLFIEAHVFCLEFKVGSNGFSAADRYQAESYALDLKSFHRGSHELPIFPVLISTSVNNSGRSTSSILKDGVANLLCTNGEDLAEFILNSLKTVDALSIHHDKWLKSAYEPTPTIIEAAQALYADHSVDEISRSEAGASNLAVTSAEIRKIVHRCRIKNKKAICFVTGVPGAGKTLVGLDIATHSKDKNELGVYLSGNGPLVKILQEALARDKKSRILKLRKDDALREAKTHVQNVHHFRDEYLGEDIAPADKVVIFDEAQRAWDRKNTSQFMRTKKNVEGFDQSEPEFLVSVMDRHDSWCVIVALIGGGQEINKGEAGLLGWVEALKQFEEWEVHFPEQLRKSEFCGTVVEFPEEEGRWLAKPELHLSTSIRSFRSNIVSSFIHELVHNNAVRAKELYGLLQDKYPIYVTRDLSAAKAWLNFKAKLNESKGMLACSSAKRLRAENFYCPDGLDPVNWFLCPRGDVRSSHALEEAASEFDVQGLELDWTIVGWDGDYRYKNNRFEHWEFKGSKWNQRRSEEKKMYLENAYRVLLTRARQGFVIFVPKGDESDLTRQPEFYDETYAYLRSCGIAELEVSKP